jgi:transposase
MRPFGSAAELERRRIGAVDLIEQGESPGVVARILGIHPRSLYRWQRQARQPGGLKSTPHSGGPPRLTAQDCPRLETLLLEGAEAHGWPNHLWTGPRVSKFIKDRFGVQYVRDPREAAELDTAKAAAAAPRRR